MKRSFINGLVSGACSALLVLPAIVSSNVPRYEFRGAHSTDKGRTTRRADCEEAALSPAALFVRHVGRQVGYAIIRSIEPNAWAFAGHPASRGLSSFKREAPDATSHIYRCNDDGPSSSSPSGSAAPLEEAARVLERARELSADYRPLPKEFRRWEEELMDFLRGERIPAQLARPMSRRVLQLVPQRRADLWKEIAWLLHVDLDKLYRAGVPEEARAAILRHLSADEAAELWGELQRAMKVLTARIYSTCAEATDPSTAIKKCMTAYRLLLPRKDK